MNQQAMMVAALTLFSAATLHSARAAAGEFGSAQGVTVLPAATCADIAAGAMLLSAGPGTRSAESLPIAANANTANAQGFTRDADKSSAASMPWVIDVQANLGRRSLAGNLIVVVYDGEQPSAVANHEANAVHQVTLDHGGCAALRIALSPEESIRPNHVYRLQLVQILAGHDVVLANASVVLR